MKTLIVAVGLLCLGNVCCAEDIGVASQFNDDGLQLGIGLPDYQEAVIDGSINSSEWQWKLAFDGMAGGDE